MNIQQVHNDILFLLNKEQVGYVSHEQIDLALDMAQMSHYADLYAPIRGMRDGRSVVTGYGMNQKIHDDLAPFKKAKFFNSEEYSSINQSGTGPYGHIVLPDDYLHLTQIEGYNGSYTLIETHSFIAGTTEVQVNLRYNYLYRIRLSLDSGSGNGIEVKHGEDVVFSGDLSSGNISFYFSPQAKDQSLQITAPDSGEIAVEYYTIESRFNIEVLNDDQLTNRLSSRLVPVSSSSPVCSTTESIQYISGQQILNRVISIYPEQGYHGMIRYLRRPLKPVFAYTQTGREISFDEANSVDLEWPDDAIKNFIINKAVQFISQHLKSSQDIQISQYNDARGV